MTENSKSRYHPTPIILMFVLLSVVVFRAKATAEPPGLLKKYCFDCHDDAASESGLDLVSLTNTHDFDGELVFENLATGKMPPADAEQPSSEERRTLLNWLAARQPETAPQSFRRLSRHEFVHSVNDLLGTELNLAEKIPEDRGTSDFDSDRRIKLSKEVLGTYFAVADEMLDLAFPRDGFTDQQVQVLRADLH